MPKMETALADGKVVGINDALAEREHARPPNVGARQFSCTECGELVRPHKSGGHIAAHFEHLRRNQACSLSDVTR
jgi:hypothetical protein